MRKFILLVLSVVSLTVSGQTCRVLLPAIDSIYEGECRKGLAHGHGKAIGIDSYEGEFRKGLPNGTGVYKYHSGDVYSGEWRLGKREGYGRFTPALGVAYDGVWRNDQYVPSVGDDDWIHDYVVKQQVNVDKVNFKKTDSPGSTVRIMFFKGSKPIDVYELQIASSSGDAQQNADYPVLMYVSFPLAARLTYKISENGGATLRDCLLDFVITDEGDWDVMIYH